eukprot:tig00021179_g19279.t1
MAEEDAPAIELEHAVAYSTNARRSLYLHPNGRDAVFAAGGCVVISDLEDPHNQTFLRGHDDRITCMSLSRSGRLLASGQVGKNSDVCVWSLETNKLLYRLSEHDHGIKGVDITDDEALLVTIGDEVDKKMYCWDLSTGYIVSSTPMPEPANCVAWGGREKDIKRRPTANYVIATAGSSVLRLWVLNPAKGELTSEKCGVGSQRREYSCLQFSADGDMLYAGSSSGDVSVVYVRTKLVIATVVACAGGVRCIGLAETGGALVLGGGDGTLTTLAPNGKDFTVRKKVQLSGALTDVHVDREGGSLLAGTAYGLVYRVGLPEGQPRVWVESHSAAATAVAYPPSVSDRFVTVSLDGTVRHWDASTYGVIGTGSIREGAAPTCAAFAGPDVVLAGASDGRLRSFEADTGEQLWSIDYCHTGGVHAVTLSSNLKFVLTGGQEGEIRLWDFKAREMVSNMKLHTSRVTRLALFSDDAHAASCSRDRTWRLWDLPKEQCVCMWSQRMGGINGIAIGPDQRQVLTVGQDKKITYWDLREQQPTQVVSGAHDEEVACLSLSASGKYFATGGHDQLVKLWSFAEGRLVGTGVGHSGAVLDVAFSPDERQVVSTGADGAVMIWNVYT